MWRRHLAQIGGIDVGLLDAVVEWIHRIPRAVIMGQSLALEHEFWIRKIWI